MVEKIKTWFRKWPPARWAIRPRGFWVIVAILLIAIWRIFSSSTKTTKVQTVEVTQGDLIQSVSTSGVVKADQYSQLTFPSGGKIAAVYVKSGQKVGKGAWIAQLDSIPLNAIYQQSLNNYRNYQAAAQNVLDQVKDHSSDETFVQKATRTAAEVARDNSYDAILAAKDNLDNAVIYAPFSGIMDTVNPSSPGMQVMPAAANYSIINPDTVYLDSEVDETDLPHVVVGQKVGIKLDAYPDEDFSGVVSNVGIVAFTSSTGGNAYHVRITLPKNIDLKFRIGMQGDADIVYNNIPNLMKVSSSTISSDINGNYVWGIKSGKSVKIKVEIGQTSIDETEIKSGLILGQEIIDNPPSNFTQGQKVSI